jgi:stage III sporulation protein AH
MKKKLRKNQVVIATLAVLIAIAGYISFDKSGFEFGGNSKNTSGKDADDTSTEWDDLVWASGSETEDGNLNPGETVLTGGINVKTPIDYAASVKLEREQLRSANKETLLEIINNKLLSEEQKADAINQMVVMTKISEKENAAEMMLKAKGFTNVVVSISGESCDVVLDMGEVTDAKRAQVEDVVKRKTGIAADKIVITPINVGIEGVESSGE